MSLRVQPLEASITIELDGEPVSAREGEPVAAAIIAAGETLFSRSVKYHRPRGAFCLSGGCSHCLMRVDGVPNVPTCRVPARAGLRVERQNAFPDAKHDLLAAADLVFHKWFNHHEFMAGVPIAETVLLKIARQLSGLGRLPDRLAPVRAPALTEELGVVIVGGGPAGLAAAQWLTERQLPYTLFEREKTLGGRLLLGRGRPVYAPPGDQVRLGALVVGLFADQGRRFLAIIEGDRLHLVFFERLLLAHGGHPVFPTFENNDLPGLYASRAVGRLLHHGVRPGKRVAVVGEPDEAQDLSERLAAVGVTAVAIGAEPMKAHGFARVEALTVRRGALEEKVECDAVALCGPVSPAVELAREGGARIGWDPASRLFVVQADVQGRTANPAISVAGELRGPMSAAVAAEQGLAAAEALAGGGA